MNIFIEIATELEAGNAEQVATLTRSARKESIEPKLILDEALIAGMRVVGEKFKAHEIFLPDVLLAAKAMYAGLDEIKPALLSGEVPTAGRVVIGTVKGDIHDIGKNLVGIMLTGAGFEVIDLGADVPPERFIDAAQEADATVIGMSALLTTTMGGMRDVIGLLDQNGMKDRVHTVVGGAPLSPEFAKEIGADAYAYDAVSAVQEVQALVSGRGM